MGSSSHTARSRRSMLTALWAVLLVPAILGLAPPAGAAPLETYGRLPSLEDMTLSPSGKRIAFIRTDANLRRVIIADLPNTLLQRVSFGEVKLRHLAWADDDHLMITSSTTGMPWGLIGKDTEWSQLSVWEVSTKKLHTYPDRDVKDVDTINAIVTSPMVRHVGNDTVIFLTGIYVKESTKLALIKVNLTTHLQSVVRLGSDATRGWLVDEAGEVVAEENYYEHNQKWQMKLRHNGHWFEAESQRTPIDIPDMVGFGPNGDAVLVSTLDKGESVWELLSLRDGKLGPPIEGGDDLNNALEDPITHRMIGGEVVNDQRKYVFFNPDLKSRWHSVENAYEGERLKLISTSADMMQFLVLVDGSGGYRYELINMNTARAVPIGDVYDGLKETLPTTRITYEAADGLKIPAYLTLPAGKPATKLPLIVFPHGGPASHDTAEFDWWTQAMAAQGYAVLRPNYRGSTTTQSFIDAGYGQWGRKMQTDLSDGVRYLAKQGTIDPGRVCIVGASYGGYAALAGVTLDPGVYRCAVSIAGISDLKRMLVWEKEKESVGDHIATRYWNRYMGVKGPDDPVLDEISPIKHIDRVSVPVLLIHGKDDTVVAYEQSEFMLKALQKANKPVELVTLKKEDHWLSRSETRLLMLQSSIAFLKANNPPD
jgi:dipeptidyl aminopeptidase/acylaminoacyl peptidase